MVMEEGPGGRGLAGDSCMEMVVHAPLSIRGPALFQALAKDWAYKMNKDTHASGKDKHVYRC